MYNILVVSNNKIFCLLKNAMFLRFLREYISLEIKLFENKDVRDLVKLIYEIEG